MTAPYLHITISDNDFWESQELLGNIIQQIFQTTNHYPTGDDLSEIKRTIATMWHSIAVLFWFKTECITPLIDYFERRLMVDIVDYFDIPEWDNAESLYIPLFANADIIIR